MKKGIFAFVIVAIIVCVWFLMSSEKEVEYKTITPNMGDLKISVETIGDVFANEIVSVGAQASGEILELNVKIGDNVKKGDIIAQLDKEKQENNLNIELAKQNSLNALKKSKELSLQISKREYQNQEKLYSKGAVSYDSLMKSKSDFYSLQSDLAQVESQIQQNKVSVQNYKKELEYTTITAPINGRVIAVVANKGQTINSSQNSPTIVKLADTSKLEIKLFINQNDVNKLKPGMKVQFYAIANEKKKMIGTLDTIDIADTVTVDGVNKGAIYYYARVYVDNYDDELKIGMSVAGNIEIETIHNTLLLPTINISEENGVYFVNTLKGNDVVKKEIKIGKSDNFNTQILDGLSVDDKIVVDIDTQTSKTLRVRK